MEHHGSSQSDQEEVWTPANKVTFLRIILIPVFVVILVAPWPEFFPAWMDMPTAKPWFAAAVFIALSLTDSLDGYLARSRNEVTDFGKFMDPLADKLLVTAALLGLIELFVIPSWVALIIIAREFIVSGIRMVAASKGEVIAASWYGKVKTVLQMVAIVLFIIKDSHVIYDISQIPCDWLYVLSWIVMLAALFMTVLSMLDYSYKARFMLGFGKKRKKTSGSTVKNAAGAPTALSYNELYDLATQVLDAARAHAKKLATAESCTGGLIASCLTAVPGSSDVVEGGIVSYSNDIKRGILGVNSTTLEQYGAVSEAVACQMAQGVQAKTGCDFAVSVTGVAGPSGGTAEKPVGTVWIGLASNEGARAQCYHFAGSRDEIRRQTVEMALRSFLSVLC